MVKPLYLVGVLDIHDPLRAALDIPAEKYSCDWVVTYGWNKNFLRSIGTEKVSFLRSHIGYNASDA